MKVDITLLLSNIHLQLADLSFSPLMPLVPINNYVNFPITCTGKVLDLDICITKEKELMELKAVKTNETEAC